MKFPSFLSQLLESVTIVAKINPLVSRCSMMVVHNLRQIGTFSDVEFLFLWLNAVMEYDI